MARIELYKVFDALKSAEWEVGNIKFNLAKVPDRDLETGDYDSPNIVWAVDIIDDAIAELQKAKQILTKDK